MVNSKRRHVHCCTPPPFQNTLVFLGPLPLSPNFQTSHFPPLLCTSASRTLCEGLFSQQLMLGVERMTASSCSISANATATDQLITEVVHLFPNNTTNDADPGDFNNTLGGEGCSKMHITTECRICQEEDGEHELESPCACDGTLKFAHRKCIQKWCNKKGDITCEICNQVYSPDYALPPARSNPDVMTIDIRHTWVPPQIDLRDTHFLAFASAEHHQFLESDYEDYNISNNTSIAYLRFMALILMLILLVRQALLITRDLGMVPESSKIFNFQVSVLQLAGFLLPCYVVSRSWLMILRQRRRQV